MTSVVPAPGSRTPRAALMLGLCAALIAWSCGERPSPTPQTSSAQAAAPEPAPILVIGLDGFEWSIAAPLVADGRMPHLEALLARGRGGKLQTLEPTISPAIWTSMATSKNPEEHGIHGFVREGAPGEAERLYDRRDRRGKALWSIFSDAGYAVRVIGWWVTWPAERVHGVMVAQTNTLEEESNEGRMWKGRLRRDVPRQVHPPERQDELLAIAARAEAGLDLLLAEIFGPLELDPQSVGGRLWENSRWSLLADEIYRQVALHLAQKDGRADLSMIYFGGADVLGHRFWRFAYPKGFRETPSEAEQAQLGLLIEHYYLHLDRVIGELVAAWPSGTDFVVVSDHGMHGDFYDRRFDGSQPLQLLNSGAHADAPPGVFVAAGPSWKPSAVAFQRTGFRASELDIEGRVHDLTPTLLSLYEIPRGKDMRGSILFGALARGIDLVGKVAEIPTHDAVPSAFGAEEDAAIDPAEAARLEQLRTLGYLGGELDPAVKKGAPKDGAPPNGAKKDGEKQDGEK
ncbi:MAG: alkaline phosphatase family protein [Planctomycetes bacterium]|nr:alkaline phosphatase family protein [Planctomycetota bacterium]